MVRRWIYMAVAIAAAALLPLQPVFSFQEDKGIIYIRSYEMDQNNFVVILTELETGLSEVSETMSVKGLYYCYKALLWSSILCLLCFFSNRVRMLMAVITACLAGAYYVLIAYYALQISDNHFATLYPNIVAVLPAVVIQMMVLTLRNIHKTLEYMDDTSHD